MKPTFTTKILKVGEPTSDGFYPAEAIFERTEKQVRIEYTERSPWTFDDCESTICGYGDIGDDGIITNLTITHVSIIPKRAA